MVGFGPGDAGNMTARCRQALEAADVIVGYMGYTKLLRPLLPHKAFFETGMTQEVDRCRLAVERAAGDENVCVISSGDAGVYGMAGLIFELAQDFPGLEVEVVPGVTAALSGAALLGAPLGHDFAVISLSDLLTPWELIAKRLHAAAAGDFALALYNPGSHTRAGHLGEACAILLNILPESRLCGIAKSIGRKGESFRLLTLGELQNVQAEMDETVFIGSSQTLSLGGRMVTPRGYRHG